MQLFEITINQISLTALIIALGLLVDNAIVIVESILVKREAGKSAVVAAIESGAELKTPLLISSLTTAVAFMPIGTAKSAVGEYTADIFYVVGIALLTFMAARDDVRPDDFNDRAENIGRDTKGRGRVRRSLVRFLPESAVSIAAVP